LVFTGATDEAYSRSIIEEDVPDGFQRCTLSGEIRPLKDFPKHIKNKTGLDTRTRVAKKKDRQKHDLIKKTAPRRPEEFCQASGKKVPKNKWRMDIDHVTDKFRGWICDASNFGIALLGDCVEGLIIHVGYLLKEQVIKDGKWFVRPIIDYLISIDGTDVVIPRSYPVNLKDQTEDHNGGKQKGVRALFDKQSPVISPGLRDGGKHDEQISVQ